MNTIAGTHFSYDGDFTDLGSRIEKASIPAFQTYLSTHSNRWWPDKPEDYVTDQFRDVTSDFHGVAHAPFVFNILTDPAGYKFANNQWKGLVKQLSLAGRLGLDAVVVHPGSAKGAPDEKAMAFAIFYLKQTFATYDGSVTLCLENSANVKTGPAANFAQLKTIVDHVGDERLRLCLDTTHAFASGIDLRLDETRKRFIDNVKPYLHMVHFNQPLPEVTCGSFRDRHSALLDQGPLGESGMKALWDDLKEFPLILEGTPDFYHDQRIILEWEREAVLV